MKTLGVTGGIGSGKTTVCKIFKTLGVPVFYSDEVSKSILFSKPIISEMKSLFGEVVFSEGKLSKKKLANLVFNNPEKLTQLNQLLHPRVKEAFELWKLNQDFPFVIKEAAILFESGGYKACDFVLNVSCSEAERKRRVVKRDNRSLKEIERIIRKQWSEKKRAENSDYIIENENLKLIPQVSELFFKLLMI